MSSTKPMNKIETVAVIGAGVIGKASGLSYRSKSRNVYFIDTDNKRVRELRAEGLEIYTPQEAENIAIADVNFMCVPTPTVNGKFDNSYIKKASEDFGKRLANSDKYCVVVVRSTVLPGTTRDLVIKTIEKASGKKAGQEFGVCMNPEYLREVSAAADASNPWFILIGEYDQKSGEYVSDVYKDFGQSIERVSLEEAEIQKYIHNLFNATKIAYFNEFRIVCQSLGANTQKILDFVAKSCEGMWNPKYGIKDLGPFDGHCLPKDTQALLSWARKRKLKLKILDATIRSNADYKASSSLKK
ncbi:MAG: UDP-glucose 6-dehydrogenase [Candidatus Parcubacteria bacterium]|jgi:UDPglucose 6-dehydrogenase